MLFYFKHTKSDYLQQISLSVNFASFLLIRLEMFCEINFANFIGKQLCWSLFLTKLQSSTRNFRDSGTSVFM